MLETEKATTAKTVERAAYSVDDFCRAHDISRGTYYNLKAAGIGPRELRIGSKILITVEAAAKWRREREAATAATLVEAPARRTQSQSPA
jgi:hypothetical protein